MGFRLKSPLEEVEGLRWGKILHHERAISRVILAIMDNKEYVRVLLYFYCCSHNYRVRGPPEVEYLGILSGAKFPPSTDGDQKQHELDEAEAPVSR